MTHWHECKRCGRRIGHGGFRVFCKLPYRLAGCKECVAREEMARNESLGLTAFDRVFLATARIKVERVVI